MDIVNHAIAGAAAGAAFGNVPAGIVAGVFPDYCLWFRRRMVAPPDAYIFDHTVFGALLYSGAITLIAYALGEQQPIFWAALMGYLSHLLLDMVTHGRLWSVPPLHPLSQWSWTYGEEWEFFNRAWYRGLFVTLAWSLLWIFIAAS